MPYLCNSWLQIWRRVGSDYSEFTNLKVAAHKMTIPGWDKGLCIDSTVCAISRTASGDKVESNAQVKAGNSIRNYISSSNRTQVKSNV
jgi:hypothetical protein